MSSLAHGPWLECAAVGHPLQVAPSRGAAMARSWASAAVGFTATCFLGNLTTAEWVGERILNLSQGNNSKEKHYRWKVSVSMVVTLISKT